MMNEEEPNEEWLRMRVLVCGDRNWEDRSIIFTVLGGVLDETVANFSDLVIIDGCTRGADEMAGDFFSGKTPGEGCGRGSAERGSYAGHVNVLHEHYPAKWDEHDWEAKTAVPCFHESRLFDDRCPAAGPRRNQQMLDEGKPLLVLAFHDDIKSSRGTKDMVSRAKRAGIRTYVISHG